MTEWEDVAPADEDNPFSVAPVDGLVFAADDDTLAPELRVSDSAMDIPRPPERPRPQQAFPTYAEPWIAGPEPTPPQPGNERRVLTTVLALVIPSVILGGLGIVIYRVMQAYGLN